MPVSLRTSFPALQSPGIQLVCMPLDILVAAIVMNGRHCHLCTMCLFVASLRMGGQTFISIEVS